MTGFEHMLADAGPWLDRYGYLALAVAVMGEGFGLLLPGGTLLGASALLAADGEMRLWVVIAVAWTAAAAGDNLGYWIGRLGGRALLLRAGLRPERLERFDGFYHRFGSWLILLGRFFDGTRQLNGLVAGSTRLLWQRFLLLDLAGSGLWVGFWAIGLYNVERHSAWLHHWLLRINPWVAGAVVIAVVVGVLIARRTR